MEENKIEEIKEETTSVTPIEEVKQEVQQTNQVIESKPVKKKKKINKVPIIIAGVCILLIVIIVAIAMYFKYTRDNRRVMSMAITNLTDKFEKMAVKNENLELSNNYTIDGNMKFDIESKVLNNYASVYPDYKPYVNLVDNLNDTENTFTIKQNLNDKKALFSIKSELDNEEILGTKFYLTEDKEYYFIKGFLDKYIENGDSNYFDSLKENQDTYDNIEYLYEVIMKSLKVNLKYEYFEKTDAAITIDGKKVNTQKISLKLDYKNGKELINAVLKDLKKDKKAKEILESYDENFEDVTADDFIDIYQELIFSVYVDNIFYNIKKYELYVDDNLDKVTMTYLDADVDVIDVYENDEIVTSIEIINESKNKYIVNIYDDNHEKVANVAVTNGKEKMDMSFYVESGEVLIKGRMTSEYSNIVKKKSYDCNTAISFTVEALEEEIADVEITIDMKAKNSSEIDEDVSNAIPKDQITKEQKETLDTLLTKTFTKLMM